MLLVKRGFDVINQKVQNQCICYHWFDAFILGFLGCNFSYSLKMPIINLISCKTECCTKTYLFALFMASKSTIAGNVCVFQDFIEQMSLVNHENTRFEDPLSIWWHDLKTEVQMLSMQSHGISAAWAFDCYRHILPNLILWHL